MGLRKYFWILLGLLSVMVQANAWVVYSTEQRLPAQWEVDASPLQVRLPQGFRAKSISAKDRANGEIFSAVSVQDQRATFRVLAIRREKANINQVIDWLQKNLNDSKQLHRLKLSNIERIESDPLIAWGWHADYQEFGLIDTDRQAQYLALEGEKEIVVIQVQGPTAWMQTQNSLMISYAQLLDGFVADAQVQEPFELVNLNPDHSQ
jgi:hypothetical protein